jgi:predicted HD superfamily hydrolase involved in NAD metabolism
MDYILEYIERNYSENRKRHTLAVCETAKSLARYYGADENKTQTAALFHDMFRDIPEKMLNTYVKHLNIDNKYYNNANLAHGKIAAVILQRDYEITDEDVLNAVRFHTTGRAEMSLLEKIIFLADAIEPGRDYPGVEKLRELAYKDLDEACLLSMRNTIEYIKGRGFHLDEDTILGRDFLLKRSTADAGYLKEEEINE